MFKVIITSSGIEKHAAEFKTLTECENWIAENADYFPEGYVAEIIDIAAIKRKEKRLATAKSRIDFGAEVMAEIVALNEERFELGLLTEEQFEAMLNDPILFKVERLLWNGSIKSAKTLIEAMPDVHFNASQKQDIIDKMDTFLLSIGEAI